VVPRRHRYEFHEHDDKYSGTTYEVSPDVHEHFDSVAQAVPKGTLAQGISVAFNSDKLHFLGKRSVVCSTSLIQGKKQEC
jgi:hypothetical protein